MASAGDSPTKTYKPGAMGMYPDVDMLGPEQHSVTLSNVTGTSRATGSQAGVGVGGKGKKKKKDSFRFDIKDKDVRAFIAKTQMASNNTQEGDKKEGMD